MRCDAHVMTKLFFDEFRGKNSAFSTVNQDELGLPARDTFLKYVLIHPEHPNLPFLMVHHSTWNIRTRDMSVTT